jgi:hypothetical protein
MPYRRWDDGADDTLLQPCISRGRGPNSLEVRSEQSRAVPDRQQTHIGGIMADDPVFDFGYPRECFVPARLKFAVKKPFGRYL